MDRILKATSDQKEENREIREEIGMLNSKAEEFAPTKRKFLLIYWLVHYWSLLSCNLLALVFVCLQMVGCVNCSINDGDMAYK